MPASVRSSRKTSANNTTSISAKYEQKLEERDPKKTTITNPRYCKVVLRTSIILVLILIIYLVYSDDGKLRKADGIAEKRPKLGRLFVETKLPGKGIGLIATRDIEQGELLIREKPLFVVPSATNLPPKILIRQRLDGLSQDERNTFFNLSYVQKGWHGAIAKPQLDEDETALAIFETNAIVAEDNTGIFPITARLNHGCGSAFNAVYSWRHDEEALVVYALKSIRRGEELLTAYTDTKRSRDERRRYLLSAYNFECQCSVCSLPEPLSSASDRRLTLMTSLHNALSTWATGDIDGKTATGIVNEIWKLGDEEGYMSGRGQLAADAVHVAAAHSDYRAVRDWAALALKWYTIELGSDSIQTQDMQKILSDPHTHSTWASRYPQAVAGPDGSDES